MSMHEIEDLVEHSIRVLVAHPVGHDLRNFIFALYEFQNHFDCSFTQARVLESLVEHRYAYRLPLDAHPAYAGHEAAFQSAAGGSSIVFVSDLIDVSGGNDPDEGAEEPHEVPLQGNEQGYFIDGHLYCDAGTPLWNELVRRKMLTGADADKPVAPSLLDVALAAASAAEHDNDVGLIAMWHALGPHLLFGDRFTQQIKKGELLARNPQTGVAIMAPRDMVTPRPFSAEEAAALPAAAGLRAIAVRTKAASHPLAYDPRPELATADEVNRWWFGGD